MQTFTGFEYLAIDLANHRGMDKDLFEDRIQWVYDNMDHLEDFADTAETPELYKKATMAIRRAQLGQSIGHIVHFDACCSGIQIMSALTGCVQGAYNTGMIDPTKRMDAYSNTTGAMNAILVKKGMSSISVPRSDVKQAVMTSGYGSKAVPKAVFGDGEMLNVFYDAAMEIAPGAFRLMDELLQSWRPFALSHTLVMPDGFVAKMKVMEDKECRIEVDELDHASFTLQYRVNEGTERGRSNVANSIHCTDAYLLRCLERLCNYDEELVRTVQRILEARLLANSMGIKQEKPEDEIGYYLNFWKQSNMADIVIFNVLNWTNYMQLPTALASKLLATVNQMLSAKPFPIVTVHDAFGCHPNNCNVVRYWYKEVMADLADSTLLQWMMNQLYQITDGVYEKLSPNLGDQIRMSNYALS